MRIEYNAANQSYTFSQISETDLQIMTRAFEYDRPYSDIPELDIHSRHIQDGLIASRDLLLERYAG